MSHVHNLYHRIVWDIVATEPDKASAQRLFQLVEPRLKEKIGKRLCQRYQTEIAALMARLPEPIHRYAHSLALEMFRTLDEFEPDLQWKTWPTPIERETEWYYELGSKLVQGENLYNRIQQKDAKYLLSLMASGGDHNRHSKRLFTELTGLPMGNKAQALASLESYLGDAYTAHIEGQQAQTDLDKQHRLQVEQNALLKRVENTRWTLPDGAVVNGIELVERFLRDGYSRVVIGKVGIKPVLYLIHPDGRWTRFDSKDMREYIQAHLGQSPAPVYPLTTPQLLKRLTDLDRDPESLTSEELMALVPEPLITWMDVRDSLNRLYKKKYPSYGLQTAQEVLAETNVLQHLDRLFREHSKNSSPRHHDTMESAS